MSIYSGLKWIEIVLLNITVYNWIGARFIYYLGKNGPFIPSKNDFMTTNQWSYTLYENSKYNNDLKFHIILEY